MLLCSMVGIGENWKAGAERGGRGTLAHTYAAETDISSLVSRLARSLLQRKTRTVRTLMGDTTSFVCFPRCAAAVVWPLSSFLTSLGAEEGLGGRPGVCVCVVVF